MPTVEERKLISLGGASLLVVLPKPRLNYYHLKAGDRVIKDCTTMRDCVARRYLVAKCLAGNQRACRKLEKVNEK